jgi:hypothetical protein
VLVNDKI